MPNVSPIRARIRVLWRILRSVRDEEVEEKNEEIKTKFCSLVSWKWLERFSSNLVCRLPLLAGTSLANLVPIGCKGSQSYIGVKIAFSFFLLIYSRVARRLLGPHDTPPCVLIHAYILTLEIIDCMQYPIDIFSWLSQLSIEVFRRIQDCIAIH